VGNLWWIPVVLSLLAAGCRDNNARIIFDNKSACGTIRATLTDTVTGDVKQVEVPVNQRVEVVVKPDVFYEYIVDFTAAGRTADNYRCVAVKSGRVRVPAGAAQTFALAAETPTPGATP
jgi:hypothetical protein